MSEHFESNGQLDWPLVLREHDRWLRTVLFARLRDGEAVDEVIQEVGLAVVRQASPLRTRDRVSPWLYQLAIRQAMQYRRRMGRQRSLTRRYFELRANEPVVSGDPLQWLLAEERRELIQQAINELPVRDAEVLLMKYDQGWTYRRIADSLGVSEAAVEARLHRARQRLRSRLRAAGVAEVNG